MKPAPLRWIAACALAIAIAQLDLAGADAAGRTSSVAAADAASLPPSPITTEITLHPQTIQADGGLAPNPVSVAPATRVRFVLSVDPTALQTAVWYKDGKALPVSGNTLDIPSASGSDAGTYTVTFIGGSPVPVQFTEAALRVETPGRQRLLNLSTRVTINPSQRSVTSGFVIAAAAENYTELKTVLIRAVGPSLGNYGVPDPLADPELHVYRQDGAEVVPPAVIAVYPGPAALAAVRVGAFPLPLGTKDIQILYYLPAGVYSARVSSAGSGTGTVLLELYEVPQ